MGKRVLITGGAGFIGSHLADELLAAGYEVRAIDNLTPQVHAPFAPGTHRSGWRQIVRESSASQRAKLADGPLPPTTSDLSPAEGVGDAEGKRPGYLHPEVELVVGDVRDPGAVRRALAGVDAVFHLAAAVGVGQSMYQIAHYTATNSLGTAVLVEALAERPVERLIVASSMSVYGEGLYEGRNGERVVDATRSLAAVRRGVWDLQDPLGTPLRPVPTPESKPPSLHSVYALSKFDQERLCLLTGQAYGVPTVALRFFNVYGPRQALSNPYTGVLAIFASRLLNGQAPIVNEDGLQRRDFVSVHDVARGCRLALEAALPVDAAPPEYVFNIGSGEHRTVLDVAAALSAALGSDIAPQVEGTYRLGDIRHCFADISRARQLFGYEPQVGFADGVTELAEWLAQQPGTQAHADAQGSRTWTGLQVTGLGAKPDAHEADLDLTICRHPLDKQRVPGANGAVDLAGAAQAELMSRGLLIVTESQHTRSSVGLAGEVR